MCESLKKDNIGQSAGKPRTEETSTTILMRKDKGEASLKQQTPEQGEDIV